MDIAQIRADLVLTAEELRRQREILTTPQADQGSIGFGKRIGDGTAMAIDRMHAVTTHDALGAKLAEVEHVLARLDAGSYGICETCGQEIPAGRLEARPWSTRCVEHS